MTAGFDCISDYAPPSMQNQKETKKLVVNILSSPQTLATLKTFPSRFFNQSSQRSSPSPTLSQKTLFWSAKSSNATLPSLLTEPGWPWKILCRTMQWARGQCKWRTRLSWSLGGGWMAMFILTVTADDFLFKKMTFSWETPLGWRCQFVFAEQILA